MVEEERFSGVALVMSAGRIVHARGYGAAGDGRVNSVTTEYHVASVTKQFTATAVLRLVDLGLMRLDAPIRDHLPLRYRSPSWNAVTLHHLLSHTGGVPDYAVERDYYDVVDGFCLGDTVDGMIRESMARPLEFEPGSRFQYSNIGFTLLGIAVEHVTSTPFHEFLQEQVLKPTGMTSSRLHVVGHVPTSMEASGHRWDDDAGAHAPDAVVTLPVTAPDGGLVTTLSDFVRWTERYLGGDPSPLTDSSLRKMTSPVVSTGREGVAASYGYGLFLGDGAISHPGYIVGFRSHFVVIPDKRWLVVVFSNNTTNDPMRVTAGLVDILEATDR